MQHVFIIGSKSLGGYGGYETFVYKLTEYHQNNNKLKYHIACKANGEGSMNENSLKTAKILNDSEFEFQNAHCVKIKVPNIGPIQAIYYDVAAFYKFCEYINKKHIANPIVYVLACRIGPFFGHFCNKIHKLGGKVFINPDGHEWKRAKWSAPVRKYWKISEQMMVKHCDLVICDSINIEKYIHDDYDGKCIKKSNPKTTFIPYGADVHKSELRDDDPKFVKWLSDNGLKKNNYYLVVGRFVPENNYETMIKEFMQSKSKRDFALITNVNNKFLQDLTEKTGFDKDCRIKFVGSVYDQELLKKIRENAYGYFHGHEVGGTNPSLLEALGATKLNLLLNVGFNQEVAKDAALYWEKQEGSLADLINRADYLSEENILQMGKNAKKRIEQNYSWEDIVEKYDKVFCGQ